MFHLNGIIDLSASSSSSLLLLLLSYFLILFFIIITLCRNSTSSTGTIRLALEKKRSHYCTAGVENRKGHNSDLVCSLKIACR